MMKKIRVLVPAGHVQAIDELVELKLYDTRDSAIRHAVKDLITYHRSVRRLRPLCFRKNQLEDIRRRIGLPA